MLKRVIILLMLLFSLLIPAALATSGRQSNPDASRLSDHAKDAQPLPIDQIIIQFEETAVSHLLATDQTNGTLTALSAAAGVDLSYARPMSGGAHVLRLPQKMAASEVATIAQTLSAEDGVVYAEPDYLLQAVGRGEKTLAAPLLTPNDTRFGDQWHYVYQAGTSEGVNLLPAWNITTGSSDVVVSVIDTGILNHSDLSGQTVPGYDFISDIDTANDGNGRDNDPSDPGDWIVANECEPGSPEIDSSWHGTHVAGTIAAKTNNGAGVAGVSWDARILPVRVLGKCGGSTSDIADAIRWSAGLAVTGVPANTNPAQVINMSLGGPGSCSSTMQNAITAAYSAGTTVVVAAGNSSDNAGSYSPANCNNVITVASTDRTGDLANYSNYGSVVEVSAPGGETAVTSNGVLSTLDGGTTSPNNDNIYAYYQGTSMAAPHVAGVAALILAEAPGYTPAQVRSLLETTARSFPAGSNCTTSFCGAGIVDAYQALLQVNAPPPDEFVYLPAVFNDYPSSNPFVNPDFEDGANGWTEYSQNGWNLIYAAVNLPVTPHSGSWAAWLGGDHNEVAYIRQQVTVPTGSPYLYYWQWISSDETDCSFDLGGVIVNNNVVDVYGLCDANETGGWAKHVVDLSAYAGQSVALRIQVETDETVYSNLYVDDVGFQSTATAVHAPTDDTNIDHEPAGKER